MNRWQNQYQRFMESESWKTICQFVDRPDYVRITENDRLSEALRFKKMIKLVSSFFKVVDIETISEDYWNAILTEPDQILNSIRNINDPNDPNIDYRHLNYRIDQIYTYIKLHVISDKAAAQATGQAFRAYREDVDAALESITEESKSAVRNIKARVESAQNYLDTIESVNDDVDRLKEEIFGEEEDEEETRNGLKAKFFGAYNELIKMQEAIQEFNQELTEGDEEEDSIIQQISDAKSSALENEEKINELLESIQKPISDLNKFYIEVVGEPNESGDRIGGLNQELEQRKKALLNFETGQQARYEELVQRINGLLPDANNAALAHAYHDLKVEAAEKAKKYTTYFSWLIGALFSIGIYILYMSYQQTEWTNLSLNLLKYGPVLIPVVWFASFFSRRRSESHRLEQEYAHKEALAKSYESFKKQIDALQEEDPKLLAALLDKTISAIAFNPSGTLDKKHSSESPAQEVANKVLPDKEPGSSN